MTLSWVGFRELAFSKTPENLIRLAHQVFSPMPFLGVGSRVLAPCTPGKNTGVGCHGLLQGIYPTRGWTCISYVSCVGRWLLYRWHHLGSLYISINALIFYHLVLHYDLIQQHYLFIFGPNCSSFPGSYCCYFFITLYGIDLSFLFVPWTIVA